MSKNLFPLENRPEVKREIRNLVHRSITGGMSDFIVDKELSDIADRNDVPFHAVQDLYFQYALGQFGSPKSSQPTWQLGARAWVVLILLLFLAYYGCSA